MEGSFVKIIESSGINKTALSLGLLIGATTLISSFLFGHEGQPIIFIVLIIAVLYLMHTLTTHIPDRKLFYYSCAAVFLFRVIPSPVEPVEWYMMNKLKLDDEFFSQVRIISTIISTLLLISLSGYIRKSGVKQVLILCTVLDLFSNIPMLGLHYGFIPLNPEYVLYFDSAFSSTIGSLSMIPLHVLLCSYTPEKNKSTYIAITASFSNAALMAGDLITKHLNKIYVVSPDDFTVFGPLLISCLVISVILSTIGIILLYNYKPYVSIK